MDIDSHGIDQRAPFQHQAPLVQLWVDRRQQALAKTEPGLVLYGQMLAKEPNRAVIRHRPVQRNAAKASKGQPIIHRRLEALVALACFMHEGLERIGGSRSAPHSLVRRVQIILASADGEPNVSIAARLGVSHPTVCHWRKKWFEQGLVRLYGEARPRRPRTHDEEAVAELLRTVLESKPESGTHWTVRSAAAASGLSKSTVGRMFQLFGVQPHRFKTFKLSTDP